MPIPRLVADDAALLVIDVQEKLMPTIHDRQRVIQHCAILLGVADELGMPYLVTEQYPKGLGRTVDQVAGAMVDQSRRIEKTKFSAAIPLVTDQLQAWRRGSVLLCGVEAHVCVLQTALDLHAAGYQCFIVSDAIGSSQLDQIHHALNRMRRAGAIVTGVMSTMYELLGDATHPSFSAVLSLAKQVKS